MPKRRDSQRTKLYAAEDIWIALAKKMGWRRVFIDIAHIEAYAETVYRWVRDNKEALGITVPVVRPKIVQRKRHRKSSAFTDGTFALASGRHGKQHHWVDNIILHELAHIWTPSDAGHDRRYAALFLKLVERWMGKVPAHELRRHFREGKVKYTPKRVLTRARKAELAARMAAMREMQAQVKLTNEIVDELIAEEA